MVISSRAFPSWWFVLARAHCNFSEGWEISSAEMECIYYHVLRLTAIQDRIP